MVNSFPGDYSSLEPPDSISNSEVKRIRANDSVRLPHVKVGHRQGFILSAADMPHIHSKYLHI